jgi:hypothetical protein
MTEQLLALLYSRRREVLAEADDPDEFECLVALVEDGTIDSFEALAKYGVE